jgi:anti-sigma B factor antagonist
MPLADVHFEPVGEVVVAHLTGEIDMSNAEEVGAALSGQTPSDVRGLVLDLREIAYLDSAGIRLIYNLRARLDHRGQQLRLVVEPGGPITDALRIADVPRAVGALETVDAAVDSLN